MEYDTLKVGDVAEPPPAVNPYHTVPPSVVKKENASVPVVAVVLSVGAVPPGHFTEAGHVTVLLPVPS